MALVALLLAMMGVLCLGFQVVSGGDTSSRAAWWSGLAMTPGGCAASTYFYNTTSFYSLATDVRFLFVEGKPAYFWSHQFGVAEGSNGYIGIQGDGSLFNGTAIGRACIFSIWNSLAGVALDERAVCGVFGGEGTGWSCRLEYPWHDSVTYRYNVFRMNSEDANTTWWGASVTDLSTHEVSLIGKIQVPVSWNSLEGPTVFFTEYYGELSSCEALPYVSCRVSTPIVGGANVTSIQGAPYGRCNYAAAVDCNSARCILTAGV